METDEEMIAQCFNLFQDKPVPSQVEKAEWHPDKDLLAMITEEGKVVLHRLNWDKLWTISPEERATSICWRPDGKVLAIGHNDGTISLHDAENGKMLRSNKPHNAAIVSLSWAEEGQIFSVEPYDMFSYKDRTPRFLPTPPKAPYIPDLSSGVSESTEERDGTDQELVNSSRERLNILCSGDMEGIICFNIFGVFPIGKINIGDLSIRHLKGPETSYRLKDASLFKVALSKDLQQLIVLCYGMRVEGTSDMKLGLHSLLINTSIFQKRNKELFQVALQVSNIEKLQDVVLVSLQAMHKQWSDAMNLFKDKFRHLSSLLAVHGLDSNQQDELVNFLCGFTASDALRQFLENSLSEGGVKRLAKSIDSAGKEMRTIIDESLKPASDEIAFRIGELKGFSEWGARFQSIGLEENMVHQAMEDSGMLVVQIERLLRVLSETVKLFENFFAWLTKSLKHLSGEPLSQSDQLPVINSQLVMLFLTTVFMEDPIMPHLDALQKDVEIQIHPETKSILEELVILGGFKDTKCLQRTLFEQFSHLQTSCKEAFYTPFKVVSQKLYCEGIMLLSYVSTLPSTMKFKEPISITYYEKVGDGQSVDQIPENIIQDYICFRLPDEDPHGPSILVIVRGFRTAGNFQQSVSMEGKVEVIALSFANRFHCIDLALYKKDQIVLLLDGTSSSDDAVASGNSLLMLLPISNLPFVPLVDVPLDIPISELCQTECKAFSASLEDGRARCISHSLVAPLVVSASRGLACLFTSQRHAMIYNLEEDEEKEDNE
ncbi:hypothetical protein SUGI_0530760 [Cryptomeria japonica]|nr:hypothetical protein SUGI_0530760 [Cryptomeria japonica]